MESSNDKPTGPSKAGKIVVVASAVVFALLTVTPFPAWVGIIAIAIWMFWSAPEIMKSEKRTFWVAEVDFFTGIAGLFWWIALAGILQSTYGWLEYSLGLIMMIATAIIIGKMARHFLSVIMFGLGLLLGVGILGFNWVAIYWGGPLAIPSLNQLLSLNWEYSIYFALLTGLVVAAISEVARCQYLREESEELQKENEDLTSQNSQLTSSVEYHQLETNRFRKANEELRSN